MKRIMGLAAFIIMSACTGSPETTSTSMPAYRPAFLVGDQVTVTGGEFAQAAGTIVEVNMDDDVYRVRLSDRSNPVFIRSYLLRRHGSPAVKPETPPRNSTAPMKTSPKPAQAEDGLFGRLAVLPVIGLDEYLAETLAWHLANEETIHTSFNVVPITPVIRKNVMSEESYSAVYDAGEDVNADYILTSFARRIGYDNVFIAMIINVHTREQLAGDFRKYSDVQDIPVLFRGMTQKMTAVIRGKKDETPKLSVELMAIPPNTALRNDAAVLTEMFAISMANTNLYSVFPRTDSIDTSLLDYETRRTAARRAFVESEEITAAHFVLSSKIDMFDSKSQILAEIIDIGGNVLRRGSHINFDVIEDTPQLLTRLTAHLTTTAQKD